MPPTPNHFNADAARAYDARNRALAPISGALHFLSDLSLVDLPAQARILCVGVGTGAELLPLATAHPEWRFVGVDPSEAMLARCAERLQEAGIAGRCELLHGQVQDIPEGAAFDAVLCILVAHFVGREERLGFYQAMAARLRPGGMLVNAEISGDLEGADFPELLKDWAQVQARLGATPESLASLPKVLKEGLTVLSHAETESLLKQAGLPRPIRFYQAFLITGWHSRKPG